MFDIHALMTELKERRAIFHNERDFQLELAWLIRENTCTRPRLEFPYPPDEQGKQDEKRYLDIYIPDKHIPIAIELKHFTQELAFGDKTGEQYSLRNQAARNQRRYDFLKDVQRLECLSTQTGERRRGYAILLTNDPLLWQCSRNYRYDQREDDVEQHKIHADQHKNSKDREFHLYEGRKIECEKLEWRNKPEPGSIKGRECAICLTGPYYLRWKDYSYVEKEEGAGAKENKEHRRFRYLAIEVKPSSKGAKS